jgi:uncharacterized protein YehS (DUF1456 family)
MRNNDVLRSLRWTIDASDRALAELILLGGVPDSPTTAPLTQPEGRDLIAAWLRRDDEPGWQPCPDIVADALLIGLIVQRRGPSDRTPAPVTRLNNNTVLKRLRLAFALRDDDVADVLRLAGFPLSKSEIGGLFRAEGHPNYRPCGDQVLRNFLRGLGLRFRPT